MVIERDQSGKKLSMRLSARYFGRNLYVADQLLVSWNGRLITKSPNSHDIWNDTNNIQYSIATDITLFK